MDGGSIGNVSVNLPSYESGTVSKSKKIIDKSLKHKLKKDEEDKEDE